MQEVFLMGGVKYLEEIGFEIIQITNAYLKTVAENH